MLAQANKIADKLLNGISGKQKQTPLTLSEKLGAIEQQYQNMEQKLYQNDEQSQKFEQTIRELEQKLKAEQEKSKALQQELDESKLALLNQSREQMRSPRVKMIRSRALAEPAAANNANRENNAPDAPNSAISDN